MPTPIPLEVKPYNVLEDAIYWWWEGIVAPRENWGTNSQEEGITDSQELENWGKRVKVRIQGVHPGDKSLLPDDQLPWAEVRMGSVGSGHKGTGMSIGVTQGTRVYGVWENPLLKKGPIILGVIGNNDELKLPRQQPSTNGFLPFSGYTDKDLVAGYDIPLIQSLPLETSFNPNLWGGSDKWMMQEYTYGIGSPTECEKVPLNGIMKSMRELIQKIEKVQRQLTEWQSTAQGWLSDKQKWIQGKVKEVTEFITSGIKWLFKEIRKYIEEEINKRTKKLYELINPPDRDKAKKGHDALMELITCLFNKLIANLFKMVGNFLTNMLDRYINVPACAVSNFVADLLGNTLGAISSAVDRIISSVSGLIGGVFSLADSILGLLGAIAGFFACEEDQECPETKEWNIFEGGKPSAVFDIDSIISRAKGIASQAQGVVGSATGLIDTIGSAVDFSGLINSAVSATSGCNVGPVFCAPPTVTFWGGGGGGGATGNVIVSAAGDILGVDIVSQGSGYKKAPFVTIEDNCGKGSGVYATAIITPDGGTDPDTGLPTYQVVNVAVPDTGSGYIPRPDGDIGGDGRVWSPKENTVIRRPDGVWEQYPPGVQYPVREGDTIITPDDRKIVEGGIGEDTQVGLGRSTQIGPGGGVTPGFGNDNDSNRPIEEQIASRRGITSIPGTGLNGQTEFDAFPVVNVGSYPTMLYLCDIYIENAGINYSTEDKIVIEPNEGGAELEVVFGPFGVVDSIRIINGGRGFTERPTIYIQSETGYNAILVPVFCISRIGDDDVGELTDIQKFNVVSVVDCVGRFD